MTSHKKQAMPYGWRQRGELNDATRHLSQGLDAVEDVVEMPGVPAGAVKRLAQAAIHIARGLGAIRRAKEICPEEEDGQR